MIEVTFDLHRSLRCWIFLINPPTLSAPHGAPALRASAFVCVGRVKWGQRPTKITTVCALRVSAREATARRHSATEVPLMETAGWGGSPSVRRVSAAAGRGSEALRRRCPGVQKEQLYGSSAPATCPWNRPPSAGRRRWERWPRWFLQGRRGRKV